MTPSISHCPECGYSLQGLPARHRCPECGFEYDEHTRVWKPEKPRALYFALMGPLGFLWHQSFRGAMEFIHHGSRWWLDVIYFVVFIPLTAFLAREVWRIFHSNKRGRYVAIGVIGLHIRAVPDTVIIPWARIRGITYDWNRKSPLVIDVVNENDRLMLASILRPRDRASSIYSIIPQMERMGFADAANEAAQRSRSMTEITSSDGPGMAPESMT